MSVREEDAEGDEDGHDCVIVSLGWVRQDIIVGNEIDFDLLVRFVG